MDFATFFLPLLLLLTLPLHPAAANTATTTTTAITDNDTSALILFRSQTDLHGTLHSNWTLPPNSTACSASWAGINCTMGRVTSLTLPSLNLRGPINSISSLNQLRHLDLRDNRLNGSLGPITNCLNLKFVYLSNNDFSGEIPPDISSLRRLLRLDLSDNNLGGAIPSEFSKLPRLRTLRLQNNAFSGPIPKSLDSLAQLKILNLSNNELFGPVPENLYKRFGPNSFSGNEGICGIIGPLSNCSSISSQIVPSNPTEEEEEEGSHKNDNSRKGLSTGGIVGIIVASAVGFLVILSFIVAYCCGKYGRRDGSSSSMGGGSESGKRRSSSYSSEKRVYANNGGSAAGDSDKSKLVFFDRRKSFELEELLRASAEMLGKGSLGTVYKAVLDDGCTVAVKRLKDANPCDRKEFEQYMDVIGKLKHPNIVKLRAYYYAKEEKLLVYDYMPNGSMHSLLHGNRGSGGIPLDWTTRISLVLGAARGIAKIHEEYASSRIPHGNVKSSNVLLDKNGLACISDFGLSLLLNPVHAIARLGGYKAPEQSEMKRLSQKSDVYSFGVLLLEVLTGKAPSHYPSPSHPPRLDHNQEDDDEQPVDLPKWVRSVVRDEWTAEVFDPELLRYKNIEEELVSMLHVAMACVVPLPEKRPTMSEVAKMIEEIRVEQSPLGEDYDESRNSMSPSVATTEDAAGAAY